MPGRVWQYPLGLLAGPKELNVMKEATTQSTSSSGGRIRNDHIIQSHSRKFVLNKKDARKTGLDLLNIVTISCTAGVNHLPFVEEYEPRLSHS
jgi:hypothetical protein